MPKSIALWLYISNLCTSVIIWTLLILSSLETCSELHFGPTLYIIVGHVIINIMMFPVFFSKNEGK